MADWKMTDQTSSSNGEADETADFIGDIRGECDPGWLLGESAGGLVAGRYDGCVSAERHRLEREKVDDIGQSGVFDGNVAWSADSTSMYFVRQEAFGTNVPTTALRRWVGDADADKHIMPAQPLAMGHVRTNIYLRLNSKTQCIATLWPTWVMSLAVSPDQHWLLVSGMDMSGLPISIHLWALQLQSKKLYTLSDQATAAACFTGPNQVAYVEQEHDGMGQVQEVTFDESLEALKPAPMLAVLCDSTSAIAGAGRDLLVLTSHATFPARATQAASERIYAVGRNGGQFCELAVATMGFMSLSPDGSRVLYIQPDEQGPSELRMMNVDGTQSRMLMDLVAFPNGLPIKPSWHGNDRITFAATTGTFVPPQRNMPPQINPKNGENGNSRVVYDIVDYEIPPTGPMKPVQTISRDWHLETKPSTLLMIGLSAADPDR